MSELSTTYSGLRLKTPVIAGSSPLSLNPETVRQLVDAGVGAIVLPSLLQEQIDRETRRHDPSLAVEESGYQPQQDRYNGGVLSYGGARRISGYGGIAILRMCPGIKIPRFDSHCSKTQPAIHKPCIDGSQVKRRWCRRACIVLPPTTMGR